MAWLMGGWSCGTWVSVFVPVYGAPLAYITHVIPPKLDQWGANYKLHCFPFGTVLPLSGANL